LKRGGTGSGLPAEARVQLAISLLQVIAQIRKKTKGDPRAELLKTDNEQKASLGLNSEISSIVRAPLKLGSKGRGKQVCSFKEALEAAEG